MNILVVIDMQKALFDVPRFNTGSVISNINKSADFLIEREVIIGVEPSLTTLLRLYYPTREQRAKFLTNTTLELEGKTPLSVWKQGGRQRVKNLLV